MDGVDVEEAIFACVERSSVPTVGAYIVKVLRWRGIDDEHLVDRHLILLCEAGMLDQHTRGNDVAYSLASRRGVA